MTTRGDTPEGDRPPAVDLGKADADVPFDPYRFGKPDVPPPPQYAPPGYVPDPPAPDQPPQPGSTPHGAGYPPMPPTQPPYGGYPPQYPGQYPNQFPGRPSYGAPPYGPYPGTTQGNGKAIAGMVLGIVSIVLCWINFFNLVIIVPAIVFSLLGLGDSKSRGTGRGQAIAGLVCVAVGIVLTVVISILEFHLVNDCSGIPRGSNAYNRCVQNRV